MTKTDLVDRLALWATRAKKGERRLILEARAEIRSLRMLLNATQSENKRLKQDNERFRRTIDDV